MGQKKSNRPHGHYCKICGEYKANEKFSGKGHAAHICKSCSKLSAAEKAEAMTINRLMNFHMGRLTASEKKWLENRVHDRRPEVASLAREVYNAHFPYAGRNARKNSCLSIRCPLSSTTQQSTMNTETSIRSTCVSPLTACQTSSPWRTMTPAARSRSSRWRKSRWGSSCAG